MMAIKSYRQNSPHHSMQTNFLTDVQKCSSNFICLALWNQTTYHWNDEEQKAASPQGKDPSKF